MTDIGGVVPVISLDTVVEWTDNLSGDSVEFTVIIPVTFTDTDTEDGDPVFDDGVVLAPLLGVVDRITMVIVADPLSAVDTVALTTFGGMRASNGESGGKLNG